MNDAESCTCDKCKAMCQIPCAGSFEDIKKIIEHGFEKKLMLGTYYRLNGDIAFLLPAYKGAECTKAKLMIGNKPCIFQAKNGLCKLHDLGLKPTEGKLALHDRANPRNTRYHLVETWLSHDAKELIRSWSEKNLIHD